MKWRQWNLLALVFAAAAIAMTFKVVNSKMQSWNESMATPVVQSESQVEEAEVQSVDAAQTDELVENAAAIAASSESESVADGSSQTAAMFEQIPLEVEMLEHLIARCKEYEVPLSLALAVIETESNFHSDAKNGDCVGYMQISSINAETLNEAIGITDLTDPYQNISSGVYMLGALHTEYQDWSKALELISKLRMHGNDLSPNNDCAGKVNQSKIVDSFLFKANQ